MKALKHLAAAAALVLMASGAQAATTTYLLESITYANNFSGELDIADIGGTCLGCGSAKAVVDDFGNVTITGPIGWSAAGFGQVYNITIASITTTLGGAVTANKSVTSCNEIAGGPNCTGNQSGFGFAVDYSGLMNDGVTVSTITNVNSFISDFGGDVDYYTLAIRKHLSETTNNFQRINMYFAVIPVPGAVWLFGSALGLLALSRRRRMAAA